MSSPRPTGVLQQLSRFYASSSLGSTKRGFFKFLVTSRPYDDIELGFKDIPLSLPTIRLSGELENDKINEEIDLVILQKVAELSHDNRLSPGTRESLKRRLLSMEHRTYLWLYLAIEGISDMYRNSLDPDSESIESLPSSVEEAYEELLSKIQTKQKDIVTTLLHIIVGARRPLTTSEMAVALGVYRSSNAKCFSDLTVNKDRLEQRIRQLCGFFIFVNHSRIYLIHQTAREFLIKVIGVTTSNSSWGHSLDPVDSERIMVRVCMEYLLLAEFEKDGQQRRANDFPRQPCTKMSQKVRGRDSIAQAGNYTCQKDSQVDYETFLDYATIHWPDHFRKARLEGQDPLMKQALTLYHEARLDCWLPPFWEAMRPFEDEPGMNNLRLASFNGHETVLQRLLDKRLVDVDEPDSSGRTALSWAAYYGHEAAVQVLLNTRQVDVNTKDKEGRTPLIRAAANGHVNVTERLLSLTGIHIGAEDRYHRTALWRAVANGHEAVVRALLKTEQIDMSDINADGRTALPRAAQGGHATTVRLFAEMESVNLNAKDWKGQTTIMSAANSGSEVIVRLLLDRRSQIDLDAKNRDGITALGLAGSNGHTEIVKLLLDADADMSIPNRNGWTH